MATSRTLSNGTLSLRFMQNAQRAKQQATAELERAKVKDEAEWEVSKEIREALGLASSSKLRPQQTIVQETSYLPFLFPSVREDGTSSNDEPADEVATSATKVSGRRTFAKGREIPSNSSSIDGPASRNDDADGDADGDTKQEVDAAKLLDSSKPSKERRKSRMNGPLTGKKTAGRLAQLERTGVMTGRNPYTSADIPVLSMISEGTSATVGIDLRQMRKSKGKEKETKTELETEKVSALVEGDEVKSSVKTKLDGEKRTEVNGTRKGPLSFLRPAGVDSPASSSSRKKSRKREREGDGDGEAAEVNLESPLRKKSDSEGTSVAAVAAAAAMVADPADGLRQVRKKKKKQKQQVKVESGLSTPTL